MNSLKGKHVMVCTGDVATICWLLRSRVHVTAVIPNDAVAQKRAEAHLRRSAHDGKEYHDMQSRLTWVDHALSAALFDRVIRSEPYDVFCEAWKKKIIGITGMHGKTMAAVWAGHLIGTAVVAGYGSEKPLMAAIESRAPVAVIELHGAIPMGARVQIVSTDGKEAIDAAQEAARLAGVSEELIARRVATIPQVPHRQEIVQQSAKLTIIDDSMATMPERSIPAIQKFGGPTCVLIAGGNAQKADYRVWAKEVTSRIRPTNLVLAEGSATKTMRAALGAWGRGIRMYETFDDALEAARKRAKLHISATILISPAARTSWKL